MSYVASPALHKSLAALNLVAWLVTAIEAMPRFAESAFDLALGAMAIVGIAGSVVWLLRGRGWRTLVVSAASLYVVFYVVRLYMLEIGPLLAILSVPQALADAFYVLWSSPVGRLSHGEVLDAARELWREFFMPLVQLGMVAAAARR